MRVGMGYDVHKLVEGRELIVGGVKIPHLTGLLAHVAGLLEKNGYLVENIDATIIAQEPKMRPHIPEMEEKIAAALQIDVGQINVKATTEEGLGFTGAREGIAAQAVCALTTLYEGSVLAADSGAARNCESCKGCSR